MDQGDGLLNAEISDMEGEEQETSILVLCWSWIESRDTGNGKDVFKGLVDNGNGETMLQEEGRHFKATCTESVIIKAEIGEYGKGNRVLTG